jgi:mono/diheme cytochrome c family protein
MRMAIVLMTRLIAVCVIAVGVGILTPTAAAEDLQERLAAADLERGRRLYEVSCDACHNANVHWRDKRLANSWPALLAQVDRWQRNAGQRWEPSEINDVAAYLNERFYRLPCPVEECGAKTAHADRR